MHENTKREDQFEDLNIDYTKALSSFITSKAIRMGLK
jgi:hypothetical protein